MLKRYILAQLPGWFGALAVLTLLVASIDLSPWIVLAVVVALLAKDCLMYPLTKHAYDPRPRPAHERMLGRVVVSERGPSSSFVRIDGELWSAARVNDFAPLGAGRRGRVVSVRGMTLLVEPEPAETE